MEVESSEQISWQRNFHILFILFLFQWDRIEISQPTMTLNELITHVRENFGAELTMLSSGVTILYSTFSNKKKNEVSLCFWFSML